MKSGISQKLANIVSNFMNENLQVLLYKYCVGSDHITLCLHRVLEERPILQHDSPNIIEPFKLDKIVETISYIHASCGSKLTLSFDDGYQDSFDYMVSRQNKFKDVRWIFFVCPEKIVDRSGFNWDESSFQKIFSNSSKSYDKIADTDEFKLVTLQKLESLTKNHTFILGNHTNQHQNFGNLTMTQAKKELTSSITLFEKLFGNCDHFAFPYGTPHLQVKYEQVNYLRQSTKFIQWSTASYSYTAEEEKLGQFLPRIVVFGNHNWQQIRAYIAVRSLITRFQRRLYNSTKFNNFWNNF